MATQTANFGAGRRESHDATAFYERFVPPELSHDDAVYADDLSFDPGPLHGDAQQMACVPDKSVALVVTSPPYFAGKAYEEDLSAEGVPTSYLEYLDLLRSVFAECKRALEPGGRMAINVANLGRKPYRSLSADVLSILQNDLHLLIRGEIIWRKAEGAGGNCAWGSFRSASNPVLRDVTERIIVASNGRFDRAKSAAKRKAEGLPFESTLTNDEFMQATLDVWEFPPESASRVNHPAPFPIELPTRLIHLFTYKNDLVLDPFVGSGTTLVAARQLGRRAVGFDLDEGYVALAKQRLEDAKSPTGDIADIYERVVHAAKATQGIAESLLSSCGFEIVRRNPRIRGAGVSMDYLVKSASGDDWYVDVTGAFTTTRAGLWRAETLWRSLGKAAALKAQIPDGRILFLTSHLPKPGSEGDVALRSVGPSMVFDAMELFSEESKGRLVAYANGTNQPLPGFWLSSSANEA